MGWVVAVEAASASAVTINTVLTGVAVVLLLVLIVAVRNHVNQVGHRLRAHIDLSDETRGARIDRFERSLIQHMDSVAATTIDQGKHYDQRLTDLGLITLKDNVAALQRDTSALLTEVSHLKEAIAILRGEARAVPRSAVVTTYAQEAERPGRDER